MDRKTSGFVIGAYAILMFLLSASFLLAALSMLFVSTLFGALFLDVVKELPFLGGAVTAIGFLFFVVFLLISLFYFFTALGLWNRRDWARIALLILCVIGLFNFPFGTLIGGYGIWFFGIEKSTAKRFKKRKR